MDDETIYYNVVNDACELYKQAKYDDAIELLKSMNVEVCNNLIVKNQYYYCKAASYEKMSIYNLAIKNAENSLKIQGVDTKYYYRAYLLLGTIYKKLSLLDMALDYYEKAIKISQSGQDISDIESNIGSCLIAQKLYGEALIRFQKALRIKEENRDNENKNMIKLNIAVAHFYLGNEKESEEIFNELIQDTKNEINPQEQVFLYHNYAGILFINENYNKAIEYINKSLNIARINQYKNEEQFSLRALGLIYRKNGQYKEALDCYVKSISIVEEIGYSNINEECLKISFYNKKEDIYQSIVELCYVLEDYKTAFRYSQKSKAKTFRDLYSVTNLKILSIEEIQKILSNQRNKITIVEYFLSVDCLYIFTINQNNFACKKIDLEIDVLNNCYQYFKDEIVSVLDREQADIGEVWLELGEYLLEPISDDIKNSDIIYFVPAGIINRFPLHSLKINNNRLINKYAVGYLPTISLLNTWQKTTQNTTQNVIYGFGNNVVEEAIIIQEIIECELYIENQVTKEIVQKTINNKNIAYFSCHGNYDEISPLDSGLILFDGKYTIKDIKSMKINTDTIILSACQSGLGTIDNNNEIIGIANALLQAGVRTVIATIWSVDIQATKELMLRFINNLKTQNKIIALQNAQISLMNIINYKHPFYNAGFILLGNGF